MKNIDSTKREIYDAIEKAVNKIVSAPRLNPEEYLQSVVFNETKRYYEHLVATGEIDSVPEISVRWDKEKNVAVVTVTRALPVIEITGHFDYKEK